MNYIIDFMNEMINKYYLDEKKDGFSLINKELKDFNTMFEFFSPLNDEQIAMLEQDVNNLQGTQFVFPLWYRDLLKITNGMNLYFGCLSFFGDQTPLIKTEKGYFRKTIARNDPNWMAPYSLLTNGSLKYDLNCRNRWLTFAGFRDNTLIAYDFKTNEIVRMMKDPVDLSMKKWKKMTEKDYESKIINKWDNFEDFFIYSINMLSKIVDEWLNSEEIKKLEGLKRQFELGKILYKHIR